MHIDIHSFLHNTEYNCAEFWKLISALFFSLHFRQVSSNLGFSVSRVYLPIFHHRIQHAVKNRITVKMLSGILKPVVCQIHDYPVEQIFHNELFTYNIKHCGYAHSDPGMKMLICWTRNRYILFFNYAISCWTTAFINSFKNRCQVLICHFLQMWKLKHRIRFPVNIAIIILSA